MIKLFCDYCSSEVAGQTGASLVYIKPTVNANKQPQLVKFDEHLCDKCLAKAQKALDKK